MKRFTFILSFLLLAFVPMQVLAQEETTVSDVDTIDYDISEYAREVNLDATEEEIDIKLDRLQELVKAGDYSAALNELNDNGVFAEIIGFALSSLLLFVFIGIIFGLFSYIYDAVTLMKIADRLDCDNSWFAWIPVLNTILLFRLGDFNPWLLLLILVPIVGPITVVVLCVIATMNICWKRGYSKALGLLTVIPLAQFILMGVLAWGEENPKAK